MKLLARNLDLLGRMVTLVSKSKKSRCQRRF